MTLHHRLLTGAAVLGTFFVLALGLVLSAPREAQAAGPLGICVGAGCVPTTSVNYVHWTAIDPGAGTASGTITLPGGHVVTLNFTAKNPNGSPSYFYGGQNGCGTDYWYPTTPYTSPQVPNSPPNCELLQLSGGNGAIYRLTLSEPIQDPVMAIVSLGSFYTPATYDFDSPFAIVSQGVGYWGGCDTCLQQQPGDILYGAEGHGTIRFLGTFPTFSWTVPFPETWHGFTFAIRTTAQLAGQVTVNEGQPATNSGTWTGTAPTFSASVGNLVVNPNGTWTWSMPTNDGPAQSQTVTITATEGGNTVTTNFPLVVNNVPPTAVLNNSGSVPLGGTVTASFTGQVDPSGPDQGSLHYAFACDGSSLASAAYVTAGVSPSTSCTYAVAGPVTIRGRVIDKDGGFSEYTTATTVLAPEGPPPFLLPIHTAFPGAPFTTCTQGIYKGTVAPDINSQSLPEYWFIKAKTSGMLALTLNAVAVNPAGESGSVTGTLTDLGGTPLAGSVNVLYPTGGSYAPGALNSGVINAPVTAGTIYRLKLVREVATVAGTNPAHHYQLGFAGADVDAGVNSPFVFEGGTQDVHVNVGASGAISLTLTQPTAPAPGGLANVSLGIYSGFTNLLTLPVTSTGSPINVNLTGLAPGDYLVALSSDQHFTMTNNSVDDAGIYFDACGGVPQPPMGKITVVKTAVGGDGTFNFQTSGGALAPNFPIATTTGTGSASFTVPAGAYSVTEVNLGPGWALGSLACTAGGTANGATATITLVGGGDVTCTFVNRFNHPPVAVNDSATTNSGVPVVIPVLANDSDVDGDTLTVASVTPGTGGVPSVNPDGTVTFTPASGFVGTATFTYTVSDGKGGTAVATVTVTVKAAAACTDRSKDDDRKGEKSKGDDKKSEKSKSDDRVRASREDDHDDHGDRDDCQGPRMTGGGTIERPAPASASKGDDKSKSKAQRWTWGFELRCDGTRGNLEYQDHTGGNFKLMSIASVVCSDDPAVGPGVPAAGFDTLVLKGAGLWNGVAGHTVEAKFVDAGEPGTRDSIVLTVKTAAGAIVSQVSGNLTGGNHQAHK